MSRVDIDNTLGAGEAARSGARGGASRWQRILIWVVLFLAVAAPYFGGLRIAYPLIFITLFLTLAALVRRQNPWNVGDRTGLLLLAAFILLAVVYLVTARQAQDALYIFNFLMLALYAPVAQFVGKFARMGNILRVAAFALVGTVLSTGVALYQVFVRDLGRATGMGSDPIWSAEAAVLLGFIALLGLAATRNRFRFLFLLGPILGTFICVLSGSRGPLLAVPVLLVAYVLVATRHWLRNIAIGLAVIVVCASVVSAVWPATVHRYVVMANRLPDYLQGDAVNDASLSERGAMYVAGYEAFLASPWLGYGWHAKMDAIVPYLPEKYAYFPEVHHHLHSDGLDFAVSGGIVGILAYLLVLIAPVAGAMSSPRDSQFRLRLTAAVMLSAGYFVFGLTYLLFGYEFHTTLYVVLAAIIVRYCRDEPRNELKATTAQT